MPLGTGRQPVRARKQGRGGEGCFSLRSQAVNEEFHGCGMADPGRECAGAICSQDPELSSCPDLNMANSLQEQMSHPSSPQGHPCVCVSLPIPGSASLQVPGTLTPSWGQNQDESHGAWQRPGKLTAGVTPKKMGLLWGCSDEEDPWSFPAFRAPQPLEPAAIPGCCWDLG